MRHTAGDEIYVTDGDGKIYRAVIEECSNTHVNCKIMNVFNFENEFSNIFFCIPKLKSTERLEFAFEKSVELGITNFIVYSAKNSVSKGYKLERWQKILLSAMKQSLRSFLPNINICNSIEEIKNLDGKIIMFEQNSHNKFSSFKLNNDIKYYFIFGPEGGLNREEIELADKENIYTLGKSRLRTETAVVSAASVLSCLK